MKKDVLREVLACLPSKIHFPYFKDRYALMLLSDFVGTGMAVADIRRSSFGRLLDRPGLAPVLAGAGGGVLTGDMLDLAWPDDYRNTEYFTLTFGEWGAEDGWYREDDQMVRPGFNLVVQLNFSARHNAPYERLIMKHKQGHPFKSEWHPINKAGLQTLAWARLDLDFATGEVLVEEVQNDWLRLAAKARQDAEKRLAERRPIFHRHENHKVTKDYAKALCTYVDVVLAPYFRLWSEAVLMAAIHVIRAELGMTRIYMYDHETGNVLKEQIYGSCPPKSLYTQLPRSFCMKKRTCLPEFLATDQDPELAELLKRFQPVFWCLDGA